MKEMHDNERQNPQEDALHLFVRLEHVIFHNDMNFYTVGAFLDAENDQDIRAVGLLEAPKVDRDYILEGNWEKNAKYGRQFHFTKAELALPRMKEGILAFLSGPRFPGIGKKTAGLIYDSLGEDCLERIIQDPAVLDTVEGLKPEKIDAVKEGLSEYNNTPSAVLKLVQMGMNEKQIQSLQSHYEDIDLMLRKDCFSPLYRVPGFGYQAVMKLADAMSVPQDDIRRLEALIYSKVRNACFNGGHTFLPEQALLQELSHIDSRSVLEALDTLCHHGCFYREKGRIYIRSLYKDELETARLLKSHDYPIQAGSSADLDAVIAKAEADMKISYDAIQKEAIRQFFSRSLMILNGGPGTGKSTTVEGMLRTLDKVDPQAKVQLCAPTGRAAKRLQELTGKDARTIHSLLKWDKENNMFGKDEHDPLDCDILICDEFSMVDTHLFASLLQALPDDCRILLIGDEDQLESVNPGKVFNDLIDSQCIPVVSLQTLFRQREGSGIASLAEQIRRQTRPAYEDGVVFEQLEVQQIMNELERIVQESPDLASLQILAAQYKGPGGIDEINAMMQELLNPFSPSRSELVYRDALFREGDRVILTRNRPEDGVYNGDIGTILDIDLDQKAIVVEFEDSEVLFLKEEIAFLKHAWCISVHKSQGSEYQQVALVVLPRQQFMLQKRLLYTGISRAKKQLYILGDRQTFENGIRTKESRLRHTGLKEKVIEVFKNGPQCEGQPALF